jgi:hypothetical protein
MLSQIESKLTSLVADGLTERTHLTVLQAPGPAPALDPGRGAVLISLTELAQTGGFEPAQFAVSAASSRRVLPIRFDARVEFFMRPMAGAPGLAAARTLLLDDMSSVSHDLGQVGFASGQLFDIETPDPGFRVRSLRLEAGEIARDVGDQKLSGVLRYQGTGEIWPPLVSQPEGVIRAIDTVIAPLPLELSFAAPSAVVRQGQSATVRVRSLPTQRLLELEPRRSQALQLAVTVLSDAPPAQRGTISSGVAAVETGFRLHDVTQPETAIVYQAPASNVTRARIEYIAIHLATPEGRRGVFLGSTALRLEP